MNVPPSPEAPSALLPQGGAAADRQSRMRDDGCGVSDGTRTYDALRMMRCDGELR